MVSNASPELTLCPENTVESSNIAKQFWANCLFLFNFLRLGNLFLSTKIKCSPQMIPFKI